MLNLFTLLFCNFGIQHQHTNNNINNDNKININNCNNDNIDICTMLFYSAYESEIQHIALYTNTSLLFIILLLFFGLETLEKKHGLALVCQVIPNSSIKYVSK